MKWCRLDGVQAALAGRIGHHDPEAQIAVVAVACDKKGERLVCCWRSEADDDQADQMIAEVLEQVDLPPLFKPRKEAFIRISNLPMLPSGKADYRS